MLKITPAEIIPFVKVENELVGTVEIQNIVKYPITYKVLKSIWKRKWTHGWTVTGFRIDFESFKIQRNKRGNPKEEQSHAND